MKNKPTIIIPCAGESPQLKTGEPKALLPVHDNEPLILRQIRLITDIFPKSEVCVVVGYEAGKVCRLLPAGVKIVENQCYKTTNVGKSIGLALRATAAKSALIVYGDLVFSENLIEQLCVDAPSILLDDTGAIHKNEVGAVSDKGYVENLFYSYPTKWCQIAYLKNKELRMFSEVANRPENSRMYGFEVLNQVITKGGKIKGYQVSSLDMVKVDVSKDIAKAVQIQ